MRVKNTTQRRKKHRNLLKLTKGYRLGRSKLYREAKNALYKAYQHAYVGRKLKKRDFRKLWNIRLNAALREDGLKYSTFIGNLKKSNIILNRKMLSEIALNYPNVFEKLTKENV